MLPGLYAQAPSSPAIALLRDGQLVYMMQRSDIEVSDPSTIAGRLKQAFEKHCVKTSIDAVTKPTNRTLRIMVFPSPAESRSALLAQTLERREIAGLRARLCA